jgi:hypothetical protein
MPLNISGLSGVLNDIDTLSLHHTNPGIGANPVAATELTDAPYARQAAVFNAATDVGGVATSALNADVVFSLKLDTNQNCQFIGLWKGATYKGYLVPDTPNNFTGTATTRTFTVKAATTKVTSSN